MGTKKILVLLGSTLLSALLWLALRLCPFFRLRLEARGNANLLSYALGLIFFCLVFVLFNALSERFSGEGPGSGFARLLSLLIMAGSLCFAVLIYLNETRIYAMNPLRTYWHLIPGPVMALLLLAVLVLFFSLYFKLKIGEIPLAAELLCLLALLALIAHASYSPGIFQTGYSDRLHADAYFSSIYHVCLDAPYSENMTSIYGHYALLYKPFAALLGGDYRAIVTAISGALLLCYLAAFFSLHLLVKNRLLVMAGAFAMTFPVLGMRGGFYWQLWPHRIFFMSLLILYGAVLVRAGKTGPFFFLAGYGICLLAIVWNTESGCFCLAAWLAFYAVYSFSLRPVTLKSLPGIALQLFLAAGTFLGAVGLVNLYNRSLDAPAISVREFLFPLLSADYIDDMISVDPQPFPAPYMAVLVFFLLSLGTGLMHLQLLRREEGVSKAQALTSAFVSSVSVLSLGQMTYYINRAAYLNLDIITLPLILLLCLFTGRAAPALRGLSLKRREGERGAELLTGTGAFLSLALLVSLCFVNLLQIGPATLMRKENESLWQVQALAEQVEKEIPRDTYAFGINTAEVYSFLGWDSVCHVLDFADISVRVSVADYVLEDIKERDLEAFLVGEKTLRKFYDWSSDRGEWLRSHYQVSRTLTGSGAVLQYLTKLP